MGRISYTVDEEDGILDATYTGEITLDDLHAHADAIALDQRFRRSMGCIADIRGACLEDNFETLSAFWDHIRPPELVRGRPKWAVVVDRTTSRDAIELLGEFAEGGPFSMRLFGNRTEANAWIRSAPGN